jgi:hypothetical protein
MCCLVRAITHLMGRWHISMKKLWENDQQGKMSETGEQPALFTMNLICHWIQVPSVKSQHIGTWATAWPIYNCRIILNDKFWDKCKKMSVVNVTLLSTGEIVKPWHAYVRTAGPYSSQILLKYKASTLLHSQTDIFWVYIIAAVNCKVCNWTFKLLLKWIREMAVRKHSVS